MGTRADFYIGMDEELEWLGSIAWDGYPDGMPENLLLAKSEIRYKKEIANFLEERDDATLPKDGWPWPWDDSGTTDFAYTFHESKTKVSCFGSEWIDPTDNDYPDAKYTKFPDMSDVKNITFGARSGLIIFTGGQP